MESRGLLEDPPGPLWRVKTLGSRPKQCFWSLFFLWMTAASCARTSPFPGGKGPDAWVQDARTLHVTWLSCEGEHVARKDVWPLVPWRLRPSSLWKRKCRESLESGRSLSFLNSLWHLCLKVNAHTSIPPCLRGEQESRTEPWRASYPRIIGNRHAMHCVVLTRRRLSQALRLFDVLNTRDFNVIEL